MFLENERFARPQAWLSAVCLGAAFVAGLAFGGMIGPVLGSREVQPVASPAPAATADGPLLRRHYPAEVLRVIDGDTFDARVQVWPGLEVRTKVRLRGIDTPELDGRCAQEQAKGEAALAALGATLREGGVGLDNVAPDKYGGRVIATASTRRTPDVVASLLAAGHGRPYQGGRRDGWCGLAQRP